MLERVVNNEETNLSRRVRSSVLDDDMVWIYVNKNPVSWYIQLSSCFFSLNPKRLKLAEFHSASRNLMTILQVPSRKPYGRKGAPSCYEESQYTKGRGLERYLLCLTSLIRNSMGNVSVEMSELKK